MGGFLPWKKSTHLISEAGLKICSSPVSTVSCFSYHSVELGHDGVPSASEKQATSRTERSQYKGSVQHLDIGVEGKGNPSKSYRRQGMRSLSSGVHKGSPQKTGGLGEEPPIGLSFLNVSLVGAVWNGRCTTGFQH